MRTFCGAFIVGSLVSNVILSIGQAGGMLLYLAGISIVGFPAALFVRRRLPREWSDTILGFASSTLVNVAGFNLPRVL